TDTLINPLVTTDYPFYTFTRTSDGATASVTDPGLALRSGRFADIGRFKAPTLRALSSRAPFFHNGQAKTTRDVVNFYNNRFNIGFTADEIDKLVAFLNAT